MTAQQREILLYQDKHFGMACEPLSQYISKHKIDLRLRPRSSMCWRGYHGKWEIIDDQLYLIQLTGHGVIQNKERFKAGRLILRKKMKQGLITPQQNGHLLKELKQDCFEPIDLSLKTLFKSDDKVFASWFTGVIPCPHGDLLQYVHLGYHSVYEYTLLLTVHEGMIVEIKNVENDPSSPLI